MPITLNPRPPALAESLVTALTEVSPPTVGHFLERGFLDSTIRTMTPGLTLVGRAVTVQVPMPDSLLLHHAVAQLEPGDVLVVSTGGNRTHAVVGAVIAAAARASGAAGFVVDGVVTDVEDLRDMSMPVYARGTSVLTAKLIGIDDGGINIPVSCGGVTVQPGDVVLGDENGVAALPPALAAAVVEQARSSDEAEPALLDAIRSGGSLPELSGANAMLARLGHSPG